MPTYLLMVKGKVFTYLLSSVRTEADPGVQAVSPQVTFEVIPGGRLPLLSAKFVVTFPAEERHCSLTSTKLYCLVTEALRCEQLARGCYAALSGWELNPQPIDRKSNTLLLCHCSIYLLNALK